MKKKSDYLVGSHVVPPPAEYTYIIYTDVLLSCCQKKGTYAYFFAGSHTPKPSKPILIFETQMTGPSPLFIHICVGRRYLYKWCIFAFEHDYTSFIILKFINKYVLWNYIIWIYNRYTEACKNYLPPMGWVQTLWS